MNKMLYLTVTLLMTVCFSAYDSEFSSWRDATGKGQIQYRWKKTGSEDYASCSLEFRNLNDDDRKAYKGKIEFVHKGSDETAPISILRFLSPGSKEVTDTYAACDRVTDVWLTDF